MVATGQWVKVELLKAFPKMIQDRGADLNKNGKIDANERLKDFNGNGKVGDLADFKKYHLNNRAAIEKRVRFFTWAASFDPGNLKIDNPIHDLLSIESEVARPKDVKAAYAFLKGTLVLVKPTLKRKRWINGIMINMHNIYQILRRKKVRLGGSVNLLTAGVKRKQMDCDISSYAVMGLAYQAGVKTLYLVSAPEHAFLRYDDGKRRFNIDAGMTASRSYYVSLYAISKKSISNGSYLKNLTRKELLGSFYYNRAGHNWYRKRSAALADLNRAIKLYPKHPPAYAMRSGHLNSQGKYSAALKDASRAIKLDPNDYHSYYSRANAYVGLKNYKNAFRAYLKSIRLHAKRKGRNKILKKDIADIYYTLGRARFSAKAYRTAIRDFTKAIQLRTKKRGNTKTPDLTTALIYYDRGSAKLKLKNYKGAIQDFSKSIKHYPKYAAVYDARSKARLKQKDYVRAYYDRYNACLLNPLTYRCKCKMVITPKPPGITAILNPPLIRKPTCVIKVTPKGVVRTP